jgi:hypothetical protein
VKLSKTTWILLVAGVILIAGTSLGVIRSQQVDQQNQIESKLNQARQKLEVLNTSDLQIKKEELTLQITGVNTQIDTTLGKLSIPEDNINATDRLLKSAQNFNVNITNISSAGETAGEIDGITSNVLPLSIQATGSISNIANFVCNLSQEFPTGIVKTVQLNTKKPEPTPTPDKTSTPAITPTPTLTPALFPGFTPYVEPEKDTTASINIVIYDYKGE